MADDASYSAFLSRANQDPSSGQPGGDNVPSTSQSRSKFDPSTTPSVAIPAPLRQIRSTFASDTDSDFEPVLFSYASDQLPGVGDFRNVLGARGAQSSGIEELDVQSWDPTGAYRDVVEKVNEAGGGAGVKVFRVELGATRVEYYVLTVGESKLLGVVAKAVES